MSLRISKNKLAEKIVGKRDLPPNTIIFDEPCEIGYHCPVCKYENPEGSYDERLQWSEYNGFIWCSVCDVDYPSTLCMPDINRAIKTCLNCVLDAKNLTLR